MIRPGQQHDDAVDGIAFLDHPDDALRYPHRVVVQHRPRRFAHSPDMRQVGALDDLFNKRHIPGGRSADARLVHHVQMAPCARNPAIAAVS